MTFAERVKSYRDTKQCSLQEAKAAIEREDKIESLVSMRRRVFFARDWHTLKDILEELLTEQIDELQK